MFAAVVLLCLAFASVNAHVSFLEKRDVVIYENLLCNRSTPCLWAIYQPFHKTIQQYLKSPCECPNGTVCRYAYDNISVTSFVHLCMLETENDNGTSTEVNI
ncbi:hypothetical protein JTE90_020705 [Oedothorax gibbosus]|uniref:Uncharacterized protein n=1 Tax=Oedothorax gibbosus TaxID=931172 RepID=A0AAV6V428_9ARAC|nr:hypothetical protein JTE90_020705 [Oedothorax gibbosus]